MSASLEGGDVISRVLGSVSMFSVQVRFCKAVL